MTDPVEGLPRTLITPPDRAFEVTPSDGTDLPEIVRSIYVGSPGNVKVDMQNGGTVTYAGVAGRLSGRFSRIYATGTTASDIVGEY